MTLEDVLDRNATLFQAQAKQLWAQENRYGRMLASLTKLQHIHDFIDELACDECFDLVAALCGEPYGIEQDDPEAAS